MDETSGLRTVTETVCEVTDRQADWPFERGPRVADVIAWFNEKLDQIPEDFRASAEFEFDASPSTWDDGYGASIKITYRRPETQEEMRSRIEQAHRERLARQQQADATRLREISLLHLLRRKYPDEPLGENDMEPAKCQGGVRAPGSSPG